MPIAHGPGVILAAIGTLGFGVVVGPAGTAAQTRLVLTSMLFATLLHGWEPPYREAHAAA